MIGLAAIGLALLVIIGLALVWHRVRAARARRAYAEAVTYARLHRSASPGAHVTFRGAGGPYDEEKALTGRLRASAREDRRRAVEAAGLHRRGSVHTISRARRA